MTQGPRRLRDDPDFRWETGCDLGDEELQVGGYDLAGGRERLLASLAAGATPPVGDGVPAVAPRSPWSGALRLLVGGLGAVAVLLSAYWLGTRAGPASAVERAPEVRSLPAAPAPALPDPATSVEVPVVEPEQVAPPVRLPAVTAVERVGRAAPAPIGGTGPEPAPAEPGPTPTGPEPAVAEAEAELPVAAPATSGIGAQMAVYEPAADALQASRFAEARAGFERYLAGWPGGDLEAEALLGLLQSTYGLGDAAGTEALARQISERPDLSSRREEILRLRAESLLLLDRCDEALLVADALSARTGAPIRKACRQLRREDE